VISRHFIVLIQKRFYLFLQHGAAVTKQARQRLPTVRLIAATKYDVCSFHNCELRCVYTVMLETRHNKRMRRETVNMRGVATYQAVFYCHDL